jgi:hypothetical protein
MSFTAGKLRVLIATTNGPVEVQLLTEEDAAIGRCVACIGGTTETADIASAYHAFVVRPTGVIEGRFGHSCYRLDVSGRIDAGSSWQLGVLAAHALLAAGRLAQENDVADAILWATGSVRPVDLTVGGVSHVPEKLANSLERLKQELGAGRPVLLAVPAANADDASQAATSELRELGAELVAVAHAQALFDPLGMKVPGIGSKGAVVASTAVAIPERALPAKPRPRIYAVAAVAIVIGMIAAGAVIFTGVPFNVVPRSSSPLPQAADIATTPMPKPESASKQASQPDPRNLEPKGPELIPEKIPFITTGDRQRIRDEYLTAPNYKALATTMYASYFVSGLPSQEAADKAAVEACENNKPRSSNDTALREIERRCELFASGTVVVTQRTNIAMPPMPWTDASVQRPFVASEIPMASQENKDIADHRYRRQSRSKALVIARDGRYFTTSAESGADEAMRRSLERCGYISKAACLVIAVDDTFVNAVPTLAKAVGFYGPEALFGVQAEERADIARRLAASRTGWQAVALGVTQHAGVKVGAISERSAVDGALENCALYDRDCRVAVIGPFLVDPPSAPAAPPAAPAASPAPTASPAPPTALPPYTPPAPPTPSASHTPPAAAAPAPSASAVPPAFRPAPEVRTTKQTTFER